MAFDPTIIDIELPRVIESKPDNGQIFISHDGPKILKVRCV
jgi:hypothetical protein